MAKLRKKFDLGVRLKETTDAATLQGEMRVDSADDKLKVYLDGSERAVVSEDQSQTLTNKTIDADDNTISDLEVDNLKAGVLNTSTSLTGASNTQIPSALATKTYVDNAVAGKDAASEISYNNATSGLVATNVQTAIDELDGKTDASTTHIAASSGVHGVTGSVVGTSDSQTLTNKTINADSNTITNIDNADIKAGAAIDASKIADGTVSNAEFQFINSLTSNAQTQINAKADSSTLTAHTGASTGVHGVTGAVVGTTDTQTLTNKTIVAASNTITTAASGNLTSTNLNAALAELQSDIDTRATSSDLTTHTSATAAHGATGAVVGTTNTQTLTNKTLTSPAINGGDVNLGTASNTSKIVVSKNTFANLDALTKEEASVYYATDAQKLYVDNGTSLVQVGTGSSGINYISNPDAEINTTGWSTFDDGAALPVDGTGGTVTATLTRSTSSPLRGSASFLFTKTAANLIGEGFSNLMTIDSADQGKMLEISFDYETTMPADGDQRVYIYDVTNALIIEPSQRDILANSGKATYRGYFQAASNSTSYRLISNIATTSATAWTFKFDNVRVGPIQAGNAGTFVSDWQDLDGVTVNNFTTSSSSAKYRRVGDTAEITMLFTLNSAATSTVEVVLPNTLLIDETKINANTDWIGLATATDQSVNKAVVGRAYQSFANSQTLRFYGADLDSPASAWSITNPFTWASGDQLSVTVSVPIVGWSTGVSASEIPSNSTVAFRAYLNTATNHTSLAGFEKVPVDTVTFDSAGAFDSANKRFVAPESGYYNVGGVTALSSIATDKASQCYIYVNGVRNIDGSLVYSSVTGFSESIVNGLVFLNKGDYVELFCYQNDTASEAYSLSVARNLLYVNKITNPAQIAPTEFVGCGYSTNASQAVTDGNNIVFEDRIFDSHNAMNTATGVYTFPVSGKYSIKSNTTTAVVSAAVANVYTFIAKKNGATGIGISTFDYCENTTARSYTAVLDIEIDVVKGDTIELEFSETLPAVNLGSTGFANQIFIKKVG